jgi:hypothetical protein
VNVSIAARRGVHSGDVTSSGGVYWAGILAYMTNPAWMAWSSMPLPGWLRWAGAALALLGAGLLVWTFRTLGPNLTDTVVTRRSHTIVTRGPYPDCRPFASSLINTNQPQSWRHSGDHRERFPPSGRAANGSNHGGTLMGNGVRHEQREGHGWLRNGNPPGDLAKAPRCLARTRRNTPCQCPRIRGRTRCRLHGGLSTGPRTQEGRERIRTAVTKHGFYSHAARRKRKEKLDVVRRQVTLWAISRTRRLIALETHRAVFTWILRTG